MKKLIFFLYIFVLFGDCSGANAASIYVDKTLTANITNGTYSILARNSTGTDGNAYRFIQEAVDSMQGGDDLFLRNGVYQEGHIYLPITTNGTEEDWSSIQSLPGEWAVLDGQNNLPIDRPSFGSVIGNCNFDGNLLQYWLFERIEITNGRGVDGAHASGFCGEGGPFIFRYCYIHDNYATDRVTSYNPGGIKGHQWRNSIIEYNHFERNASLIENHNGADINIYSDYIEDPTQVVLDNATRNNEIRYNLFNDSPNGYKSKNSQWLSLDHTGAHTVYKDIGEKIHHNIFKDQIGHPVLIRNDFAQVHHNIFDQRNRVRQSDQLDVSIGEEYSNDREPFHVVVYNNIFLKTRLGVYWSIDNGDSSSYLVPPSLDYHPHFHAYNNIFQEIGAQDNGHNDLNIYAPYGDDLYTNINKETLYIKNNLFIPRTESEIVFNISKDHDASISTAMNDGFASAIYASIDLASLHPAGEDYIVNSDFIVGGGAISTVGIGGSHPYLSNITLPNYLGAVDPNAQQDWLPSVLQLGDVNYLISGAQDVDGGSNVPNPPVDFESR